MNAAPYFLKIHFKETRSELFPRTCGQHGVCPEFDDALAAASDKAVGSQL